ncbi:hypothetical protein HPB47_012998 [Ixodes persulcatus]|uniref:Uncharacterized protein n=1 Tax=Ixodes persulcatus TaxID=34615 RepID=A0AC60NS03_IXOPE|nr:hypothetical protein HPB47_012998 [Ixodes persulcatus]
MKKTAAPGPGSITAKLLFNMDGDSIKNLGDHFNGNYWSKGERPKPWKGDDVRLIPKPKKDLSFDNLRTISLTSCLRKAFECINSRLVVHVEKQGLLSHTQFGFRPQDLLERTLRTQTTSVSAQDLKGAFDNVTQESVLRGLATIDHGRTNRGRKGGTFPHPGIEHAIYPDDITIWCKSGSDAEVEESPQRAAHAMGSYSRDCGLQFSPQKSELLVVRNPYNRRPPADLNIYIDGQEVFKPEEVRILGKKPATLYADAVILLRGNTATLTVADPRGNLVRTASVYTTLTEHAEEAAIGLAPTSTKQDDITIITDSQRACCNFAKDEIGEQAVRILSKVQFTSPTIIWAPGHACVKGNEAEKAAARAFPSNRDSSAPQPHSLTPT